MSNADKVFMVVSFVQWRGWQRLKTAFHALADRNAPVRIITTTYIGATDLRAIEELTLLPNVELRIAGEVQAALEAVQSAAVFAFNAPSDPEAPRTTFLHSVRHVAVNRGDSLLLVGTVKGAFILRSNAQRVRWEVGGPYFHGHNVYALAYDNRAGRQRIWASTQSYWGTSLRSSDDFGKSWTIPQSSPIRFPPETSLSLKNIRQITPGLGDEPEKIYCGVEPAALFESSDSGETWSLNRRLFDHPHRARWLPSNGGLALHTIVLDPVDREMMYVAVSTGGVYRTCDGGQTWTAQNRGLRSTFTPSKYPEFGQCVHKIVMHPARRERLFLQNHWGVYRSDDCAETWTDIGGGLPSDFGFPIVVLPRKPDWVYIVPVDSDQFWCSCNGRLRVYRMRNAGGSWEALSRGLPQKAAYETVLRDAMTTDACNPTGMYFGTRSGELFCSRDEGGTWQKIAEGLPSILCVRSASTAESSDSSRIVASSESSSSPASPRRHGTGKSRSKKVR